jgi:hypothetical protein
MNPFKKRQWINWQHVTFVTDSFGYTFEVFRSVCLLTNITKYATVRTGTRHDANVFIYLKKQEEDKEK